MEFPFMKGVLQKELSKERKFFKRISILLLFVQKSNRKGRKVVKYFKQVVKSKDSFYQSTKIHIFYQCFTDSSLVNFSIGNFKLCTLHDYKISLCKNFCNHHIGR